MSYDHSTELVLDDAPEFFAPVSTVSVVVLVADK